jgi:hypothetical protein
MAVDRQSLGVLVAIVLMVFLALWLFCATSTA